MTDRRGRPRAWLAGAAALLIAASVRASPGDDRSQVVSLTQYTPLASNLGMAERLLSPLKAAQIPERLAALGKAMRDQPIDLRREQFRIYVPRKAPAAGYGLLVFIPPWDDNHLPAGWGAVLEAKGIIFVSAARSGNAAESLSRREPLALLAAYNVSHQYAVDGSRLYVSGFSGGSRVALRLAVAYPDVFRGALLDAGADTVGQSGFPLPPRSLFDRFRTSSRIVYFTGERDVFNVRQSIDSADSLRRWCVANVSLRSQIDLGHDVIPPAALAASLGEIDKPPRAPTPRETQCWARVVADIDGRLDQVDAAIRRSDRAGALTLLERIDKRFGGLAAPRSPALAKILEAAPP